MLAEAGGAERFPGSIQRVGSVLHASQGKGGPDMIVRRATAAASIGASFLLSACGGGGGGIGVTLADFSVTPDESSASAGDVTFDVTNDAEQTHEFVIIKTDLAEDQLPLDDQG